MFEELKYRWALRKFLKQHKLMRRSFETIPDDPEEPNGEPRYKFTMARELNYQEWLMRGARHRWRAAILLARIPRRSLVPRGSRFSS